MPSKKKDGKQSKKGKSKKGEKKFKKMTKKEKKLKKKYSTLEIEDKLGQKVKAVDVRRDELEWEAVRLMDEVTVQREERIRFQLQRDFFWELMNSYWKKFRCLLVGWKLLILKNILTLCLIPD